MLANIIFAILGFMLGFLGNHIRDIANGLWHRQFGTTFRGFRMSLKRSWPAWLLLVLLVVGAYFVDRRDNQVQADRDSQLIQAIDKLGGKIDGLSNKIEQLISKP